MPRALKCTFVCRDMGIINLFILNVSRAKHLEADIGIRYWSPTKCVWRTNQLGFKAIVVQLEFVRGVGKPRSSHVHGFPITCFHLASENMFVQSIDSIDPCSTAKLLVLKR